MDPRPRRAVPGQLPDRVYWVRRGLVLVALIVVVAIIAAIVSAILGSQTAAPAASSAAAATSASSEPPSSSPTPSTSASPSASATPSAPSASATAPTECAPSLLELSVKGPSQVRVGATAALEVSIKNTGSVVCVVVLDGRFVLRVVSGSDQIWSTADCAAWMATGSQTVQPGAAASFKTTWDRHRSTKECKVVATTLKSGTYVANAMYTGAVPANWPMTL